MSFCAVNPQEPLNATGKGTVHIVPNNLKETSLVFVILSLILHLFFLLPAVALKPFDFV